MTLPRIIEQNLRYVISTLIYSNIFDRLLIMHKAHQLSSKKNCQLHKCSRNCSDQIIIGGEREGAQ